MLSVVLSVFMFNVLAPSPLPFSMVARAGERTRDLIMDFHLFSFALPLSYSGSPMLRSHRHGILTEGEGTVQLTSTFK